MGAGDTNWRVINYSWGFGACEVHDPIVYTIWCIPSPDPTPPQRLLINSDRVVRQGFGLGWAVGSGLWTGLPGCPGAPTSTVLTSSLLTRGQGRCQLEPQVLLL